MDMEMEMEKQKKNPLLFGAFAIGQFVGLLLLICFFWSDIKGAMAWASIIILTISAIVAIFIFAVKGEDMGDYLSDM